MTFEGLGRPLSLLAAGAAVCAVLTKAESLSREALLALAFLNFWLISEWLLDLAAALKDAARIAWSALGKLERRNR